jgi:hypothetical protein
MCEEAIKEGNLGLLGVVNLISGKCGCEQKPIEEVVIIKERG